MPAHDGLVNEDCRAAFVFPSSQRCRLADCLSFTIRGATCSRRFSAGGRRRRSRSTSEAQLVRVRLLAQRPAGFRQATMHARATRRLDFVSRPLPARCNRVVRHDRILANSRSVAAAHLLGSIGDEFAWTSSRNRCQVASTNLQSIQASWASEPPESCPVPQRCTWPQLRIEVGQTDKKRVTRATLGCFAPLKGAN